MGLEREILLLSPFISSVSLGRVEIDRLQVAGATLTLSLQVLVCTKHNLQALLLTCFFTFP